MFTPNLIKPKDMHWSIRLPIIQRHVLIRFGSVVEQ